MIKIQNKCLPMRAERAMQWSQGKGSFHFLGLVMFVMLSFIFLF